MVALRYCFCLDSGTIGTDTHSSKLFLSRFSLYRDRSSLFGTLFVSIPVLSGLMIALRNCFCPDSATIGTDPHSSVLFLSRFSYYRDRCTLFETVFVPIQVLSRQFLTPRPLSCLDSGCIETASRSSALFLSRFRLYRDYLPLLSSFLVPIQAVSGLLTSPQLFSCPDSGTIETVSHSSALVLSRFRHYRDCLPLFSSFLVPIQALSRLLTSPQPFSFPQFLQF